MDKDTRNAIERATQRARKLLEDEFAAQLEGTFDILPSGEIAPVGGAHLSSRQAFERKKIVGAIEHKRAAGMTKAAAVDAYTRDAAFTTLNRFVALKMLEARELLRECVSKGDRSAGYVEYCGMAPGIALLPAGAGYRLYLESLFDELATEVKVLFDRRDSASILWPKRQTFEDLLALLNAPDLAKVWEEDETIGWIYQFFNSGEERRKMRDESQAPRNSRELAVRNQFFTPRYVVEFLTDNTLGRTWFQMREGKTVLAERCAYLVKDGEVGAARAQKDPRDIKVLDPACGSGHFLLYAFDLLVMIYEEAWEDGHSPYPLFSKSGNSIVEDYPTIGDLRKALPALILKHNLHGVDIDPRCAQIAQLALWMRAQRSFKDFGIARAARQIIRRANIVIAEPMPGEADLHLAFAKTLHPALLGELFHKLVERMHLAGELGSLLKIDEALREDLDRARKQFVAERQTTGFLPATGFAPERKQGELNLSGVTDASFFEEAERRIVEAVTMFAQSAEGSERARRRMFADDAGQGVALLDLMRKRFDVVLMNPPFGAGSLVAKKDFEKAYPRTKNDLYAAFVERGVQLLHKRAMLGAISSRTGFFLSSFQKWRAEVLLREAPPVTFADLGLGVMDAAMVESAAYCLESGQERSGMKTVFLRTLEELHDKESVLRAAIRQPDAAQGQQRFEVDPQSFASVPGAPFAYWVSAQLRSLFKALPAFESEGRSAKQGLATADDFRFVRTAWEVPSTGCARWFPFAKGGKYSPFYADVYLMVNWEEHGAEISNFYKPGSDRLASRPQNTDSFFRPGLTWPLRTKSELSLRALPTGCVFSHKGPAAVVENDDNDELLSLLSIGNSKAFRSLVEFQLAAAEPTGRGGAARSYEVGVLQRTPVAEVTGECRTDLVRLARVAWSLKRSLDTRTETSHAFMLPVLLQANGGMLAECSSLWSKRMSAFESNFNRIEAEIADCCFDLYGIDQAERSAVVEVLSAAEAAVSDTDDTDVEGEIDEPDEAEDIAADTATLTAELVSWAVGVAFGRFDVRLATGARALPPEPEPFDALPVCSPAMLTGDDGLPLSAAPAGYPLKFPENGILVDDPGHPLDLTAAVRAVFDVVFGADAHARWNEAAAILDPKEQNLRNWLSKSFFEQHLKRHSKSRRKAPIVWQLATPSSSYTVWLYAHRITKDTFFQVQNDLVAHKLFHEEGVQTKLEKEAASSPSPSLRKALAAQASLLEELRTLLDEVKRIAALWQPDLDDGVVLTMAPLFRLVPQHKAWQKELKAGWDGLAAGKFDWAHLAMHLWPERVVPKCATDRSLAIAHGLEDVFWVEATEGKWKARPAPTRSVDDLVRDRTSSAVKASLKSLVEAPIVGGGGAKRGRKAAAP